MNHRAGSILPTFRIDDDDCLSMDYVEQLRNYMVRLGDKIPLGYSRANGLVVTHYASDRKTNIYRANLPFNSMGTALRVHGDRTVLSFGHNALHKRFAAIVDNMGMGYISIKIDGHDSLQLSMDMPHIRNTHTPITVDETEIVLEKWFSFIGQQGGSYHRALMNKIERAFSLAMAGAKIAVPLAEPK